MSEITLVKQNALSLSESERDVMRRFMFENIKGLREQDQRSWARFWRQILDAEVGELFSIETWFQRFGPFHRLHMKMESVVFDGQERIETFDQFRIWLKIGAGFVDWLPGPKGGIVPIPKSISYKKCDEAMFQQFHQDSIAFLRTPHAQKTLWPHLKPEQRSNMLVVLIERFV